ncbi:MAG: RtcB family protein [Lentisphaeria bacterium]|nr:RtcB family protein [Lentisphaeria bacterium]NQZ67378.1 RtcB family protein [Lentisphaeria bacterium]
MKKRELLNMGIYGDALDKALETIRWMSAEKFKKAAIRETIQNIAEFPETYIEHENYGDFAKLIMHEAESEIIYKPREKRAPYEQWGTNIDVKAIEQMQNACDLPVAEAGALMPDAHLGYGLPIGGVLATENAVIPYAVGVDIACRMKLSIFDMPVSILEGQKDKLINILNNETRFGMGSEFENPRMHDVLDQDWSVTDTTKRMKDKAWRQLGSSGSGNHFVEYGVFSITEDKYGLDAGEYLALMSHSGSRGAGAQVCQFYSKLAKEKHSYLPKQLINLAWLDMDTADGQEYWAAMNLMGDYAAANHACIHKHIAKALKADVLFSVENHHNFAWKETHFGKELYVHRKGATPAGEGELGIIPGSMADPAYLVKGKGLESSLKSAAHGAGRLMSRTQAKNSFTWHQANKYLQERNVTLISAGIDEVPMVYKNIDEVMAAQTDLLSVEGKFQPRIVKMADPGEKPED